MTELFRKEALEANDLAHLGGVLLKPPLSHTAWALLALALAVLLLTFLVLGEYTKRTRVTGLITPDAGVVRVLAPQPGIVLRRLVEEGDLVAAGQPLVELTMERMVTLDGGVMSAHAQAFERLAAQRASLQADRQRREKLGQTQRAALLRRSRDLADELQQVGQELATQRDRLASAREQLARAERLAQQGFLSDIAVQQKRDEVLEQRGRLQALERGALALRKEEGVLSAELAQLPLRSAREVDEIERAIAGTERELALAQAQRQSVITAPVAGRVTAVTAQAGQAVGSAPLLTILPEGTSLLAHLYAPSRSVGFVEPQQKVLVRFAAYPYQKFGQHEGTVLHVSRSALVPTELPPQLAPLSQQLGADGVYRITVALNANTVNAYGKPQPLAPGMQLEADILQDRRRLVEWLFEPLIGFAGRL